MSTFNFAFTAPFPKGAKITPAQAFEALRIKAREPARFIPVIEACEVLEEAPTYLKRKATMKGKGEIVEDVYFYAPALVTFKSDTGIFITNLISEDSAGNLFLTFTFSWPLTGIESGSGEDLVKQKELKEVAVGAVTHSVKVTMDMFEEGKLN